MFAIMFRYAKTLVAFLVITAIIITGIVLCAIFDTDNLTLAVRLIGLVIAYLLFSAVIFMFSVTLLKNELHNKGNQEADSVFVIMQLNRLIELVKIKPLKRVLLLERAAAKIDILDFESAELDVSDAMAAGIKGDMLNYAFLLYAQLTFFKPDLDRFFKYSSNGREYLLNIATFKKVNPQFISVAANQLNILNAQESFLKNDVGGALKILDGVMTSASASKLAQLSSRLMAVLMQKRSGIEPSEQYTEYIRVNAKDTMFEQNLNKILDGEIN